MTSPAPQIPEVIYLASVEWAPPEGAPPGFGWVGTVWATFANGQPAEAVERTAPHAVEQIAQQAAAALRIFYQTHFRLTGVRLEHVCRTQSNPPQAGA